jgi:putative endonuclease
VADKRALGAAGEEAAARFLKRGGFRILARNLRFGRTGELDIVAREGGTLVFVEVKARTAGETIGGLENITVAKQRKLWELAALYLRQYGGGQEAVRFDAVEVVFPDERLRQPTFHHIRDAFRG